MLHLNVVAVDAACSVHGAPAAVGASHHGGTAHGHRSALANQDHGDRVDEPCQTPSQSNCCQALASCAATVLASAAQQLGEPVAGCSPAERTNQAMLSYFIAPDTPPPKA
jgi:hypothetical protein